MTDNLRIELPKEKLAEFCRKWNVCELALFGSVLGEDFRPDSDVDVLVDFKPGRTPGLFAAARIADELEKIFGREVDLLTRPAVEQSRNYIRRKAILSSLRVVYVS